jgi:hypothetical protein
MTKTEELKRISELLNNPTKYGLKEEEIEYLIDRQEELENE